MRGNDTFLCPYCGQENCLFVDFSAGNQQEFVTDCEICCAPIVVTVSLHGGKVAGIQTRREND